MACRLLFSDKAMSRSSKRHAAADFPTSVNYLASSLVAIQNLAGDADGGADDDADDDDDGFDDEDDDDGE